MVTVLSPEEPRLGQVWFIPLLEQFLFDVRACSEAHVHLSTTVATRAAPTYDLIIGAQNNMQTTLVDENGVVQVQVDTPEILHCYENRDFWITWNDGIIRLGEGMEYGSVVLEYIMPSAYYFIHVSLLTDNDFEGEWNFRMDSGKQVQVGSEGGLLASTAGPE